MLHKDQYADRLWLRLAWTALILVSVCQWFPLPLLSDKWLKSEIIVPYLVAMFATDLLVAWLLPPPAGAARAWFVMGGAVATFLSLSGMVTFGALTIWPSMVILAIGATSYIGRCSVVKPS